MFHEVIYFLAAAVMVVGAAFTLLATIGLLRLPDLFTRIHAASKAGVLGAGLLLAAVAIVSVDLAVAVRAVSGIVFLVLTTPVSAHLLARAAFRSGQRPVGSGDLHRD